MEKGIGSEISKKAGAEYERVIKDDIAYIKDLFSKVSTVFLDDPFITKQIDFDIGFKYLTNSFGKLELRSRQVAFWSFFAISEVSSFLIMLVVTYIDCIECL